jgi:hypothetical protein
MTRYIFMHVHTLCTVCMYVTVLYSRVCMYSMYIQYAQYLVCNSCLYVVRRTVRWYNTYLKCIVQYALLKRQEFIY